MVHLYYGDGKGKTTAAMGLALRAAGAGLKVGIIQFMKGYPYSEVSLLNSIDGIFLVQTGRPDYIYKGKHLKVDVEEAERGLATAYEFALDQKMDLVILDEISVAIDYGLLSERAVLDFIDKRPEKLEIVITGRYPSESFFSRADYITEMVSHRHPYEKGILSREGIDH